MIRPYLARGWRTDLPRLVLLLQAANAVSFFGYGLILPFEIIYLHQIRGFATATAGLVLAAILGTATLVTPPTGTLLDHFRPKPILIVGNLSRCSLVAVAAAGLLSPQGFSRCRPEPGYRSGCGQGSAGSDSRPVPLGAARAASRT